ncbi:hypothetical protein C8A03DRAFT_38584 [Achaetomium macrosporum]|uniref:Modin n=1 Tax=Achaetomium macrosporum TaxID=79813 RepID=A0AAN7HA45_9PEZI|nr:hypothetical protein C8A03DRAFT_38584 [Achaetomium macrosporum]
MNNNTTSGSGGGSDGNNDVVNWVALVVSLVALLGTFAQVLQQYIASAAGYSNCGESVMGKWHESKKRRFRATELRFEVQFETPVIFVCPPGNDKGPLPGQKIHFVDGTRDSLRDTRSLSREDEAAQQKTLKERRVHTADNERASWVTLLSQLQSMEKESGEWQQNYYKLNPPQSQPLPGFQSHTLAVAIQAKKRSWDTMPTGVKKPYATTTMCHLLEIAAMMGIYWKEFDRSRERYRAEGNGYFLTGTNVPELGLMFTFQIYGKTRFQENRVIPVDEVKELCCGFVSTLFQEDNKDRRRIEFPNEDPKDLSFLQLGSTREIAETMVLIECNTDTANYFRSDETKHGHLFPVPFELLGMLGKTLRIRNSAFRMLPNPTPYVWDKNFFNLRRLIREYWEKIDDSDITDIPPIPQIQQLKEDAEMLVGVLNADKKSNTPGYSLPLLNALHDVLDRCDAFLKGKETDRDLVRMVVREHFQEVMRMINDKGGAEGDTDGKSTRSGEKATAERFDELTAASPERRQEAFMELYFFKVLREVRKSAVTSYRRRQTTHYAPSTHSREASVVDNTIEGKVEAPSPSASGTPSRPISPVPTTPGVEKRQSDQLIPTVHIHPPDPVPQQYLGMDITTSLDSQAAAIWCTLVLRMLCWLLLHDFNKKDVQIAKSELLGSRLPVYIA